MGYALNQIGYQGGEGPIFTLDDGTLPDGKLILVKLGRDENYNKVLIALPPTYASVLREKSPNEFTAPDSDFVLGSYVEYQQLGLYISSYKYPKVTTTTWRGYKAIQNNWSTNSKPYSGDLDTVSYGAPVTTDTPTTTTPAVINKAATPNNTPFFIGLGVIALLVLLAQAKD